MFSRFQEYRVLESIAECYRVLQSITECYRVLLSVTEYKRLLKSITVDLPSLYSGCACVYTLYSVTGGSHRMLQSWVPGLIQLVSLTHTTKYPTQESASLQA